MLWSVLDGAAMRQGGRIMRVVIVTSCFIWFCCVSSATTFLMEHGVRLGQQMGESMQEQDVKDNTQEKNISKSKRFVAAEESMDHSKPNMNRSPPESLHNVNMEQNENNGLPDLNTKLSNKNNLSQHENVDESEDYQDIVQDAIDTWIIEYPEGKQKRLIQESDDEQSGDGPTSLVVWEDHSNSLMKSNIEDVDLEEAVNKEYINILENTLDEDLRYILNYTNNNMSEEQFQNKTNKDLVHKEVNHEDTELIISTSEDEASTTISKDSDDDESVYSNKTENHHFVDIQEDMAKKSDVHDAAFMQKESAQGEEAIDQTQQRIINTIHGIRDVVLDVKNSSKMMEIRGPENTTDKTGAIPRLFEESPITNSKIEVDPYGPDINSSLKKEISNLHANKTKLFADPCANFHCKRGKTCKTDEQKNPFCACQDPDLCQPVNVNDRVCGTDNKTYTSDCHLFATKCQLEGTKEASSLHLHYQGPCKYIPPCTGYELVHFPFRMRDWLKNVLVQLYERGQENPELLSEKQRTKVKKIYEDELRLHKGDHNIDLLEKDFQKNYHMYVYPVHWQFNQLDQHSIDRLLTRSELSALRVPLIPMEHCVTTFLQGCNTNNDKHISLHEWCHCFGIRDGDIDEDLLI